MKRAVIVASPDQYANGVKPAKLQQYLASQGYTAEIFSTHGLSRLGKHGIARHLPAIKPHLFLLYILGAINELILSHLPSGFFQLPTPYVIGLMLKLRGRALVNYLHEQKYDLLICESSFDEGIFLYPRVARTQILDLPAPLAEELYYGMRFPRKGLSHLQKIERNVYKQADYLSFHWHTYTEFVKKLKYDGTNFVDISYGTEAKNKRAVFSEQPRIVFLGYLGGYWANLPLLAELCRHFPSIDVYGGPKPPAHLRLNYKGYAPRKEILAQYQFGLVTITNDPLRQHSFSSKQLEYASFGLPVFTPAWRQDPVLEDTSIYYTDVADFAKQLQKFSSKNSWEAKSESSLHVAQALTWTHALKSLEDILKKHS